MKNDNSHAIRLVNSLEKLHGKEKADEVAALYPLSKSADFEKKFVWAQSVCGYLDENFDDDAIREIRRSCRCNDGKSNAAKLQKYLGKSASIAEFVEKFNAAETFASLEYISERELLFCYPECYCSCVKRSSGLVSKTWCYCTLGNAAGTFTALFGDGVRVELIESIKTGGSRCVIRVCW